MSSVRSEVELFEVVSPVGRAVAPPVNLPAGVPDLSGKTVCELWDSLFRGEQLFPILREELLAQFGEVKFIEHSVFGNTHGPDEAEVVARLPELLRMYGCDVVLSGVGG